MKYCESVFQTKRRPTREVLIGNAGVGGANPIRIQSMTTSNTRDVQATVEQAILLADAGCEIVRVTVQGMKEAEACEEIKNTLVKKNYNIPLVADIHFFPPAAMKVIDFVDKVRVNPGNYADKRASFKTIDYDDESYEKELLRIEEKFTPLVEKCKKLNKSMRIGTNHGSLSDRIMNRYGDTPKGMLESALEFARICRKHDYHSFLFSMKSSNPQVMIQAYRLLTAEMMALKWDYPLHLGVTEAGEGEDGRIKSAMGIGSLLLDGIGDTIRVSLTEDAWNEIDPCKRLIALANTYEGTGVPPFQEHHRHIDSIAKRSVALPKQISMHRDGSVILQCNSKDIQDPDFYKNLGCKNILGFPKLHITSADSIFLTGESDGANSKLHRLQEIGVSIFSKTHEKTHVALLSIREAIQIEAARQDSNRFAPISAEKPSFALLINEMEPRDWSAIETLGAALIVLSPSNNRLHYCRQFFDWLQTKKIDLPVILKFSYSCSKEDLVIQAAAEFGSIFCDGFGDGIWIDAPYEPDFLRKLSFNILQAARMRTSKTDFISCPSCGRTLFDLQEVSKQIRNRTSHLPGVKIAIMGCIVNGPGEMADADFGYVGSKPGMIDLYVGKTCVEKDISFADATDRLVDLIKAHGRWIEPPSLTEIQEEINAHHS